MNPNFVSFSPQTKTIKKLCVKFLHGKCRRDASQCFFRHNDPVAAQIVDQKTLKINRVCLFNLKGKCFYGDKCWYFHPPELKFWIVEWFTDRVNLLFNDESTPDGKHTIIDLAKIGEELNFLLACFKIKMAHITTINLNFSTFNMSNDFVFNVECCLSLISLPCLQTLQLSVGSFEVLLRKQDEINIILQKSVKLKNLTITDLNKINVIETQKVFDNSKCLRFINQLKDSFLEYFEIEAIRPANKYDQILKVYIFMISSLIKSQIGFVKFSLNQDVTFLINTSKNKIVITMNYSTGVHLKRLMDDFWDGVLNLSIFKEVTFNFISDWFSGLYTHEIVINKICNLNYLELDFRRINVEADGMELLWADVRNLNFLNSLRVLYPNAYIDSKILTSVKDFLKFAKGYLKSFFIKIKVKFINQEDVKAFLMVFTTFSFLQRLELNLDFNVLQMWTEDIDKQQFLSIFITRMFRRGLQLLSMTYSDRTIQFRLNENLEKWLFLKKLLVYHLLLMKMERSYKTLRREIFYELFREIHKKTFGTILNGLKRKWEPLFSCLDLAENESEGAFYERFLQI